MSKTSPAQNPMQTGERKEKEKKKKTFSGNLQENSFLPKEYVMSNLFADAKSPQKVLWSNAEVF